MPAPIPDLEVYEILGIHRASFRQLRQGRAVGVVLQQHGDPYGDADALEKGTDLHRFPVPQNVGLVAQFVGHDVGKRDPHTEQRSVCGGE